MEIRVMVPEETKVYRINTMVEIQTRNLRKLARVVDPTNVKGIHVKIKTVVVPFVEKRVTFLLSVCQRIRILISPRQTRQIPRMNPSQKQSK